MHWTASDALSGLAGAAPDDATITGEGDDLSASATVADKAGNATTATVGGIKIDRTAPTTTVDTTELPESGWYTGAVDVTLHSRRQPVRASPRPTTRSTAAPRRSTPARSATA